MFFYLVYAIFLVMKSEHYYEISKSKFYSYFYEFNKVEDFKKVLEDLKKEHKKATHICYAYIIDDEGTKEKAFDDGEPKGTAGMPILNVLKRKGLRNVAIFVVRYFGGTKLGAGGLVRAYTKSASGLFN